MLSSRQVAFIITAIVIGFLVVIELLSCKSTRDAYLRAYNFGFPTHGSYNYGGGPLRGYFPGRWWYGKPYAQLHSPYPRRPYRGRRWYYRNFIRPYLTGACRSSSKDADCEPGRSKVKKDTDDDGVPDEWLCCRDSDLY